MNAYEEQLQTTILSQTHVHTHDPKINIYNDNDNESDQEQPIGTKMLDPATLAENLLRTEDVYRKVCIKLRQLVAGWSWIKPFPRYHAEQWAKNQQDNPLPPDHALKYLNLLENIRERRQDLIQVHVDEGVDGRGNGNGYGTQEQQKVQSRGIMQWFTDAFSSASYSPSRKDPNQSNGINMAANGPLGSTSNKSSWKTVGGLTTTD
jgi:hypothetical protein